ncbi:MAG TPA: serine hydrolase, partial [Trinickia sp.]|nr:serine hydrolase [Trinickia sp.]
IKNTGSRLSVGSVLSREDMLHIALMASENRAAAALSRYYPGGRPAFLEAMNAKAKQLGMTDTHFESPSGLTSENVSSARDLVKMVNAAYQYPLIRKFSTDESYDVFTGKRTIPYRSTNALVRNPTWDIGLQKTGFINEAGECLVMQATIEGRPVIMVLLDSSGKYSRFADATRVRNWLDAGGAQRITSADAGGSGT